MPYKLQQQDDLLWGIINAAEKEILSGFTDVELLKQILYVLNSNDNVLILTFWFIADSEINKIINLKSKEGYKVKFKYSSDSYGGRSILAIFTKKKVKSSRLHLELRRAVSESVIDERLNSHLSSQGL